MDASPSVSFGINVSGPPLNLISQLVKAAGRFRIEYLRCQAPASDDLFLYPDQQFQVFSHAQGLSSFPLRLQPLREVLDRPY
jgi:hypothetical protein